MPSTYNTWGDGSIKKSMREDWAKAWAKGNMGRFSAAREVGFEV
jgi:hypothetical protein